MAWRRLAGIAARGTQRRALALGALASGGAALAASSAEQRNAETGADESRRQLFAWGSNQFGQLGVSSLATDQFAPQRVDEDLGIEPVSVSAFGEMSALHTVSDEVFGMGRSTHGSLGQGQAFDNLTIPAPIPSLCGKGVRSIALGEFHHAAVDRSGAVWSAGRNWTGEIGREGDTTHTNKVDAPSGVTFTQVACGKSFTAAVASDGTLFTWGSGRQGVLGRGDTGEVAHKPTPVPSSSFGGEKVKAVACGQELLVVLTESGKVFTCGNNDYFKLGLGASQQARVVATPQLVPALTREKVAHVDCGDYSWAAVTEDGKLFMCGRNADGQLGNGSKRDLGTPTQVKSFDGDIKKVCLVRCGGSHTMAVLDDGSLWVWGKGRNGQLGVADELESVAAYRTTPHKVTFFNGMKVVDIAAGRDHSLCVVESK